MTRTPTRILFIDDDKHLTRIMRDLLEHEQFDVQTAASAEEGLRLLKNMTPDLIVLDISMPGIGGIGFLKRIAKPDGSLLHPVLVLTARAVMKEFFDTIAVDGFLPKPCAGQELLRKIDEIITKRKVILKRNSTETKKSQSKSIVVGEDDPAMRQVYSQSFVECGFDVHFAETGPEVIEQAVSVHPDAIVMKELLPNMNASVVARLVKVMPHIQNIPIIIHDDTRDVIPPSMNDHDVERFIFSSKAADLVTAVQDATLK